MNALLSAPQPAVASPAPLSLAEIVAPLLEAAADSSSLLAHSHDARVAGRAWNIPKFLLLGQRGGGQPIRVAIFAGLDAGSADTALAVARLLLQFELAPALARDYALFAYPVVNAEGFDTPAKPLAHFERRYAADRPDDDVRFFKSELANWAFDGLLSLRSDPHADGFHAAVRSEVIGREVALPALETIARTLPSPAKPLLHCPDARHARFADLVHGKLVPPASSRPHPFEIEIFAPSSLPIEQRVIGLFLIVQGILLNYRRMISHAANL